MDAALANALLTGSRTGAELRAVLGVSQPTLSRILRTSRAEVTTYDMLPMLYAPLREELPTRNFTAPAPTPAAADQWQLALPVARAFWQAVNADVRVSREFRDIAAVNAAVLSPRAGAGGSGAA
jgi:hypothetical protein